MDIARYLDRIDRLCSRPFPAEHGWSEIGRAGPGYWLAELAAADRDGSHEGRTVRDLAACGESLARLLDARWGPQPLWSTVTLRVRLERGEDIPEPWGSVGVLLDEVSLWQAPDSDRWVAVGVAAGGGEDPVRLLAVVTDVDPP